ncbi:MAG: 16S rRNA (guanine(527)-N(7))-methyltransferase RsmG, partial [Betaproteobacteria bacterium]|nr:16S rRNA (guanine(527)-N(7))-methyltransferase RsmG [Betaproteobacteria bacterium]
EDKVVSYHLLDSLAVLPFVPKGRLLDVGSGAGLPGLPLAVVNPDLHVTLLDSNHKKSAFQRQAIAELGLRNVLVVSARAENYQVEEKFSAIISRAFADLTTFVEVTSHLIRPEGAYLAMKGVYPNEELEQLSSKANLQSVQRLQVAGLDAERHLVILRPSRLEVSA